MKKPLLFLLLFFAHLSNAQDFWTEVSRFPDNFAVTMSVVNADVIWLKTYNFLPPASNAQEWWRSSDGGQSWQHGPIDLGSTDLYPNTIHAISETTAYVSVSSITENTTGGVWITQDSGVTWNRQSLILNSVSTFRDAQNPIYENLSFVHFWDSDQGIVVGNPVNGEFEVFTTADAGTTWIAVSSTNFPAALPDERLHIGLQNTINNVISFPTNKDRIFKSNDRGLTWTVADTSLPNHQNLPTFLQSVAFKNETQGVLVADLSSYRTTNGTTWENHGWGARSVISFVPETSASYFSWGEHPLDLVRGESYSMNDGQSWVDLNETDQRPLHTIYAVQFKNATVGFCMGTYMNGPSGTYFYKLGEDGFNRFLNTRKTDASNKLSATPNPTSKDIVIFGKNIQTVTVFDISGKKVMTGNYSVSDHVSLDISKLQSGIYMAKVTDQSQQASVVKILKK